MVNLKKSWEAEFVIQLFYIRDFPHFVGKINMLTILWG
jgi:hypothetical protein